jgi:hypothetical protein
MHDFIVHYLWWLSGIVVFTVANLIPELIGESRIKKIEDEAARQKALAEAEASSDETQLLKHTVIAEAETYGPTIPTDGL